MIIIIKIFFENFKKSLHIFKFFRTVFIEGKILKGGKEMKKIKFKSILCLILVVSMSIALFSCDNKTNETNHPAYSDTITEIITEKRYDYDDFDGIKDYKIIQVEDGYRLVFDNTECYEQNLRLLDSIGITFYSIRDLHNGLINGRFSGYAKLHIFHEFPKDEHGIIMPDPYNLYVPVLPEDFSIDNYVIHWSGKSPLSYRYDIVVDSNKHKFELGIGVHLTCLTYDLYNQKLENEIILEEDYPDAIWTYDNERYSIIYSLEGENLKREQIRYTISNGNKTMFVIENYTYYEPQPYLHMTAFCVSDGAYFTIEPAGYGGAIPDPEWLFDPEWLLKFDVEKYVPTEYS